MAHLQVTRLGVKLTGADGRALPLWDLDLELVEGATLAIVADEPGLASAMLAVLAGQCAPDRGGVLLDGREVDGADPRIALVDRRARGWGLRSVAGELGRSARKTIGRRLTRLETEQWVRHNLYLAGVEDLARQRLARLSEAAVARVQLARALVSDAAVLCLDHLFDGLDDVGRRQCVDGLLELQGRITRTFLMAVDDLEQAVLFADRVLYLETGGAHVTAVALEVGLLRPRARIDLERSQVARALLESLRKRRGGQAGRETAAARHPSPPESPVVAMSDWVDARPAAGGKVLEKPRLMLGFLPLIDCAPLVVALEEGFFAGVGLDVRLSRESSWSNVLDKVSLGLLDGAQMLAAMPLATTLDPAATPLLTGIGLGRNGDGITVSPALRERLGLTPPAEPLAAARALRAEIERRSTARDRQLVLGVVAAHSSHNYLLRYWLACGGIDPDHDLRLVVVPPPQMVAYLAAGMIDGFCVGEPWNTVASDEGTGCALLSTWQVWNNHPEKVLAVTRTFAEAYPNTHLALVKALLDACWWLDKPDNRATACQILGQGRYVNISPEVLARSLAGSARFDAHQVFHAGAANFPWHSHAAWLLAQMVRWGQVRMPRDVAGLCAATYRTDVYRQAVGYGDAVPADDWKTEGIHEGDWSWVGGDRRLTLGPDRFMDGRVLDGPDLDAHLAGYAIPAHEVEGAQAGHAA